MARQLQQLYRMTGPVLCNIEIRPDQKLLPFLKYGAALENQQPPLNSDALEAEMLIPRFNVGTAMPAPSSSVGI